MSRKNTNLNFGGIKYGDGIKNSLFFPQHYKLPSEVREKYPHLNLALCNCPCTFSWCSVFNGYPSVALSSWIFCDFKARNLERKALSLKCLIAQFKY